MLPDSDHSRRDRAQCQHRGYRVQGHHLTVLEDRSGRPGTAAEIKDPARRKQLWAELQKTLVEDQPALFLAVPFQFLTRREELQGVPLNVFNFVPNYYNAWLKRNK